MEIASYLVDPQTSTMRALNAICTINTTCGKNVINQMTNTVVKILSQWRLIARMSPTAPKIHKVVPAQTARAPNK